MDENFDVVVIGGGAAGLSAGIALTRSLRTVLMVDAGDPRNATAGHVHNFLTRDDTPPGDIYAAGRVEFEAYGGRVIDGRVDALARDGDRFRVTIGQRQVSARRIVAATGTRDELPDIPGLAERWGRDVLHCPYCHGYEVRDQRIGILGTGPMAVHQALLFSQLSSSVTLLQHTGPAAAPEENAQLAALGIEVRSGTVVEVVSGTSGLTGVRLADGSEIALEALVVAPVARARAEVFEPLGLHPSEVRVGDHLIGTKIDTDPAGATSVTGVWAAGNISDLTAQVMSSAAAGLMAGARINADLISDDAARALRRQDHPHIGVEAWDERYAELERIWSGQPNAALVTEVAAMTPGRALDVGSGEGADAVWLAEQGWDVTGLDVSAVALDRAARHAEQAGTKVTWLHAGLVEAALPPATFDLVSAQYAALLHTGRHDAERALLATVAPNGTLLVVHHADIDVEQTREHGFDPADYVSPADVAAMLGAGWRVEAMETRERQISGGGGAHHSRDVVLRARRLG